jgi:glycosyltransferase involved in cell wall biosynthesis
MPNEAACNPGSALPVVLVDPSLFTAPYDAALHDGLVSAGVAPRWAVRPLRPGDRQELPAAVSAEVFYRHVERLPEQTFGSVRRLAKGLAHAVGLMRLHRLVRAHDARVVHVQWAVLPLLDALTMRLLRRRSAVVLTVHDTVPFNGDRASWVQRAGFHLPIRMADQVIVHTHDAQRRLVRAGVPGTKISVIAHGPLRLPSPLHSFARAAQPQPRVVFTCFGELKPYKGIDLLIEALGQLPAEDLEHLRIVIAGRPRMDVAPIQARIAALGLNDCVDLRLQRLNEGEMAELFAATTCFVFPYRHVDASGAFHLTMSYGRWTIATRVGGFGEAIRDGVNGTLVSPGDPTALADALHSYLVSRRERPHGEADRGWEAIGAATRAAYGAALKARAQRT